MNKQNQNKISIFVKTNHQDFLKKKKKKTSKKESNNPHGAAQQIWRLKAIYLNGHFRYHLNNI